MILILAGLVMVAGAIAILWYFRPHNGVPARAATLPLMETLIPLSVTSGLALGVAMVIAGIFD
jgi:hypothetical protein